MDADIQAAEPPIIVKIASVAQGMTGIFVALSGVQVLDITWREDWVNLVPPALCAMGVFGLFLAAMQFRSRAWAGVASAVNGALTALSTAGWAFFTFGSYGSCMLYMAVPLSMLALILSAVSIGPVVATANARRRLADRGMDLGL